MSETKTTPSPRAAVLDLGDLLDRTAGDAELASQLVGIFLEYFQQNRSNLLDAVSTGDIEGLRLSAHALKGASANVSGHELAGLCSEIEMAAKAGDLAAAMAKLPAWEAACQSLRRALDDFRRERSEGADS